MCLDDSKIGSTQDLKSKSVTYPHPDTRLGQLYRVLPADSSDEHQEPAAPDELAVRAGPHQKVFEGGRAQGTEGQDRAGADLQEPPQGCRGQGVQDE